MAASVRAHANLQLFLARKSIARFELPSDPYWGEHNDTVDRDHALFHLQVAYRCHLCDLCEQRQITLRPLNAKSGVEQLREQGHSVPEMEELAEKEEIQSWLRLLVEEDFLPAPGAQAVLGNDVIAVTNDQARKTPELLTQIADELQSIFMRHRDTQQEY